jgi:hypothetical protein
MTEEERRERLLANKARYRAKNKAKIQAYNKEYRKRVFNSTRRYDYKTNYGITIEQYESMLVEQNNVCAICLRAETATNRGKVKRLAVDHCHITGKVRGLLCHNCNTTLGKYEDKPELIKRFIEYLEDKKP